MIPLFGAGVRPVIVDACSLLSLYAAEEVLPGLKRLGVMMILLPQVRHESLWVMADGPERIKVPVDNANLVREGILVERRLEQPSEQKLFVDLAGDLDDGEAACCAMAISRNWSILTDDGKAVKTMSRRGMGDYVVTTPDALRVWADAADVPRARVGDAIRRIRDRASYVPPPNHPLLGWWKSFH